MLLGIDRGSRIGNAQRSHVGADKGGDETAAMQ